MVSIKWSELLDAFEFASIGSLGENVAFVDLDTGLFHFISEEADLEEETPEDLESSDRYLALPHKNELELGKQLALSFIGQHLPNELDKVVGYFHKRGAFSRFKDLLEERGILEAWFTFEKQATEQALRQWCDEHDLQIASESEV